MTSIGIEFGYPVAKLERHIWNFALSTTLALVSYSISIFALRQPIFAGMITCLLGCIISAHEGLKKGDFWNSFLIMEILMDMVCWLVVSFIIAGFFSNLHQFLPIREIDFGKMFAFPMSFGGAAMMNRSHGEKGNETKKDTKEMNLWKLLSYSLMFGASEVASKDPTKIDHGSTRDTPDILLNLLFYQFTIMFFVIRMLDGLV